MEFGAWDGKSESNTYYFISQQNYHGVMIEADPFKYNLLCENMEAYGTICINAFVRPEGENKLDNILSLTLFQNNSICYQSMLMEMIIIYGNL